MNGSWRALEVTSNNEAWLAGSTGEWLHLYGTGSHSTVAHYQDAIWISPDSNLAPHYRGIAVTPHAVLGSVIASPGFIRRAEFDDAGKLKLPRTSAWMEEDSAVFMDAILAVDNSTLVAMGDPIDECLCVIRSEDEGRSWAKVPCALNGLPGVPLAKEGEAAFAASNGNLASAGDTLWMLSGGGASRVYRSLDRGQSWMVFDTPSATRKHHDRRIFNGLCRRPTRHHLGRELGRQNRTTFTRCRHQKRRRDVDLGLGRTGSWLCIIGTVPPRKSGPTMRTGGQTRRHRLEP